MQGFRKASWLIQMDIDPSTFIANPAILQPSPGRCHGGEASGTNTDQQPRNQAATMTSGTDVRVLPTPVGRVPRQQAKAHQRVIRSDAVAGSRLRGWLGEIRA